MDNNLFPKAKFTVCIESRELDTTVLHEKKVAIKCKFGCSCYTFPRKTEFYICTNKKNKITNRDLIKCLIDNNFDSSCSHFFLEEFIINTSSQVTAYFTN
jgi:hypothetical protein